MYPDEVSVSVSLVFNRLPACFKLQSDLYNLHTRTGYGKLRPRWGLHVNIFNDISMKKSYVDIKLKEWPILNCCNGHENPDCSHFSYRTKSVHITQPFSLSESFCNQMCIVSVKCTIGMQFQFEHPFAFNDLLV